MKKFSEWALKENTAGYVDKSPHKNKKCGNCKYLYENLCDKEKILCSEIDVPIKREGYCELWKPCSS